MKKEILGAAALALGTTLAACSESSTGATRPLEVVLTASAATAAVGDSIDFVLSAQGALLQGVAIEFGDGAADTTAAEGAVTARITRRHAYSAAGTYSAIGTAVDGTNLGLMEIKDTLEVVITGAGGF